MGNEVATRSKTELANETAYDPFARAADDMAGSSAIYAKFNGNSGEFTYGSNAEEIEVKERMAANVAAMRRGWICWKESEVVEEIMIPIMEGAPPAENTLTDHGPYEKHADGTEDGWSGQVSLNLRLLGEDHDGVEITYKTSTKSAMRPLGDLIKQYSRAYKEQPGCIPIIEFDKGSYMPKEKKHGKKYFPTFKIVDWIDEDELMATYGEGNKVNEGDENDNLVGGDVVIEPTKKAIAAPKADKPKVTKAAAAPAETAPAVVAKEPAADETRALSKAELLAAKRAQLEAEMAALEADSGDEEADEAGDEGGAEEADAGIRDANVTTDKPAPAETRTRRRSF